MTVMYSDTCIDDQYCYILGVPEFNINYYFSRNKAIILQENPLIVAEFNTCSVNIVISLLHGQQLKYECLNFSCNLDK